MSEAGIAVAASVLMHVTWNLIARHQPRDALPLWWILLAHLLILGPWGLHALLYKVHWTPEFAALLAASSVSNAVYFMALRRAYELAPVALVYPLVRSSPFLIALWSVLFLQETLHGNEWLGIAISITGLLTLAYSSRSDNDGRALPYAMAAMLSTSIYSLTDRAAASRIPDFAGIIGFISVGYAASWLMLSVELKRSTGAWIPCRRPRAMVIIVGGLCVGLAYALVIHAMRYLPSAVVVAYTNTGIVIATALSIFVFKERVMWKIRVGAAFVICIGLYVLRA